MMIYIAYMVATFVEMFNSLVAGIRYVWSLMDWWDISVVALMMWELTHLPPVRKA